MSNDSGPAPDTDISGVPVPAPSATAWFHCFAGIAGDMALGSLLDAGADLDEVVDMVRRLPLGGWALEAEPVLRGGIAATRAVVRVTEDSVVRTHSHIVGLIEEARLPERARRRSLAAFDALARAEGALHRRPPSQVHFHEVGGHDAVVDIVGTSAALEILGVDLVTASAVATGTGVVRTAHGILPNPAPAVVELLRGVPTQGRDINVELTTPSGAAILTATASAYGPLPTMTITATGFGAGQRDLDQLPNCTQVVLGTPLESGASVPGQPVSLLEVNVDDATGEALAHAVGALMAAGAHDAWVTPVIMKKGRPGHTVSVLADTALAASLSEILRVETGSLGVRGQVLERWPASRSLQEVDVEGVPVRVKVSPGRIKVEHDDAARAARRTGLPLREVVSRAEEAWRQRTWPGPDDEAG
ncbi:MAG: nickel pincer cofactor biosynthesis protein LarC [Actinobacteria bacterium]|nr:MAG: nickel pincer cofactor biosynthesis protein LarC [Actinomycetota bacterium]